MVHGLHGHFTGHKVGAFTPVHLSSEIGANTPILELVNILQKSFPFTVRHDTMVHEIHGNSIGFKVGVFMLVSLSSEICANTPILIPLFFLQNSFPLI